MPRYALKIEYDGRPFVGWQWQAAHPSVQAALEAALARIAPEAPPVTGAGPDRRRRARARAGGARRPRPRLGARTGCGRRSTPTSGPRRSRWSRRPRSRTASTPASTRSSGEYLFRLVARRAPLVHDRGFAWRVGHALDLEAMRAGAAALVGRHDFTTFRSSICQAKSPVRTLDALEIEEVPAPAGREYRFRLRARSFLHNQVRGIVGTLERVGAGAWPPERVGEALAARSRAACGPVSPPDGLYLTAVRYPADPFAASPTDPGPARSPAGVCEGGQT